MTKWRYLTMRNYKNEAMIINLIELNGFDYFFQLKHFLKSENTELYEYMINCEPFLILIRQYLFKNRLYSYY